MKNFLDSDLLRGVQFYQNTVPQKRNIWQAPKALKTSIELMCHSSERVNYLFGMCFVHGTMIKNYPCQN